jgi:LemA protein
MKKILPLILSAFLFGSLGCGIQSIPQGKNKVEAATSEVTNQYKRRADLVPNLVNTVKGYASHEKETLTAVIEARSKATQTTIDPTKMDANQIKQYQDSQSALSQALGRLMVIVEKYPELKADRNFRELQAQLEGTENRISVARNRLIQTIQEFNDNVTVPPSSWTNGLFYHYQKLPQWNVSADEQKKNEQAPQVKF